MGLWLDAILDVLFPPSCAACGAPGPEPFCRICDEATLPAEPFELPGLMRSRAIYAYGGPVADALRHLKFHDRPDLGRPLGRAMRAGLERCAPFDLLVAVPTTPRRRIERGYDQTRELVRGLGLRPAIDALERVTEPAPQMGLDRERRLENMVGAFAPNTTVVRGRRVLLVDDIVTTGATAQAASAALHAAGAAEVQLLAFARTP